jgi:hypothetical protein
MNLEEMALRIHPALIATAPCRYASTGPVHKATPGPRAATARMSSPSLLFRLGVRELAVAAAPAPAAARDAPEVDGAGALATLSRDFGELLRALGTPQLDGIDGARERYVRVHAQAYHLQRKVAGPFAAKASRIAAAAEHLFRAECDARRAAIEPDSLLRDRLPESPAAKQSVALERRLAAADGLMARNGIPARFRTVDYKALLLSDAARLLREKVGRLRMRGAADWAEVRCGECTPSAVIRRYLSMTHFLEHLREDAAAWRELAGRRLGLSIEFAKLRQASANSGVLCATELAGIERCTDPAMRRYFLQEAARGVDRMMIDWRCLGKPPCGPLDPDRPTYGALVGHLGAAGRAPHLPVGAARIAESLDFVADCERRAMLEASDPAAGASLVHAVAERLNLVRAELAITPPGARHRLRIEEALQVFTGLEQRIHAWVGTPVVQWARSYSNDRGSDEI